MILLWATLGDPGRRDPAWRRQFAFLPGLLAWFAAFAAAGQVTTDQLKRLNSGLANEAVSAIEIFATADTVATGRFHYDNPGSDDPDFSTLKIPLGHKFGAATNQLRPFLEGYLGYFDLREDVRGLGPPTGKYRIQSYSVTAGGGLAWRMTSWLSASPRLLLAYGRIWQNYNRNVPPGDPTANLIIDWDADALTLLPSVALDAHWPVGRWKLGMNSSYTYLHTIGLHHSSPLVNLDAESHVWRNEISARYEMPWRLFQMPVSLRGLFARHDLAGHLGRPDFVDHFYEARVGVSFGVPPKLRPVREFGLSGAYYFEGPLTGYSVGMSLDF